MASLGKSYKFRGIPQEDSNPRTFVFKLLMKKGRFGRAEPFNPYTDPEGTKTFQGSFSKQRYNLKSLTVDGTTLVNMNYPDNTLLSHFDINELGTGTLTIIVGSNFPVTSRDSIAELVLEDGRRRTPWIPYRENPQFNYSRSLGMIDWDVVPAKRIQVIQDVDMDIGQVRLWPFQGFTLIGLLAEVGMSSYSNSSGIVNEDVSLIRILANIEDDDYGSSLTNDENELLPQRTPPALVAQFRFTNSWLMVEDPSLIGSGSGLRIIVPGKSFTQESFLLKYHELANSYQLLELLCYPFMEYNESYHLDSPSGPRKDSTGTELNVDIGYRKSITGSTKPLWVDRLRQLSLIRANDITNPSSFGATPAPKEYEDQGFIQEFHYLNPKIKISKLVKLNEVEFLSGNVTPTGIHYGQVKFTQGTPAFAAIEAAFKTHLTEAGVAAAKEILVKTSLFVFIEPNASGINYDNFSLDTSSKYIVAGKLFNPAWNMANSGLYNGTKLTDEANLWEYFGIGIETANLLKSFSTYGGGNAANKDIPINPYSWALVVRGKGSESFPEEAIKKHSTLDFLYKIPAQPVTTNADHPCGPADYPAISTTTELDAAPNTNSALIPISSLCGHTSGSVTSPVTLHIDYSDDGTNWYELDKKLILPNKNQFHFDSNTLLQCPLIPENAPPEKTDDAWTASTLVINYPEAGSVRSVKNPQTNQQIDLPKLTFDVEDGVTDNGLPFKSKCFRFRVFKNGQFFPYQTDTSQEGWLPIITDGKLTGIKLNLPVDFNAAEKPSFFLRCINITQTTAQNPPSTVFPTTGQTAFVTKRGRKLRFAFGGTVSTGFQVSINKHSSSNMYNCEVVGLHQLAGMNPEKYIELVPGRGVKTMSGHGMSFNNAGNDIRGEGLSGRIQGSYVTPYIDLDPFDEAGRIGTEKAEYNGISSLKKGSELECFTTASRGGIINLSTATINYEKIEATPPRINVIYDEKKNEAYLFYNSTDNRLVMKRSSFEWIEVHEFIASFGTPENAFSDGITYTYVNDKLERTIYLGVPTETAGSAKNIKNLPASTLTAYDINGLSTSVYVPIGGISFDVSSASNPYHIAQIKIKASGGTGQNLRWASTLACTISYVSSATNGEFVHYGFKRSDGVIQPTYHYLFTDRNKDAHILDCPVISNATSIKIEFVLPNGLNAVDLNLYKSALRSARLSDPQISFITEEQISEGASCFAYKNPSDEIFIIYQGEKLYDSKGKIINRDVFPELKFVQVSESLESGMIWRHPRMDNKEQVNVPEDIVAQEKALLASSGLSQQEINSIVTNVKQWDRPMVLSTLSTPTIAYNAVDGLVYHFGFTDSLGEVNNGNLVVWPSQETIFTPDYSIYEQNKASDLDGNLILTKNDTGTTPEGQRRIIALDIDKQIVSVVRTANKLILVFFKDNDGSVRTKVSDNNGTNWNDSKVRVFTNDSFFAGAESAFVLTDDFNSQFHFFALVRSTLNEAEFHLYSMFLPQFIFYTDLSDEDATTWQQTINTTAKRLVVGDPTTIPQADYINTPTSPAKTVLANVYRRKNGTFNNLPVFRRFGLSAGEVIDTETYQQAFDKNITTLHHTTAYFDAFQRLRVFYINEKGLIAAKVSEDYGQTWKTDGAI